uniref:Uncharacterized protein n=1 Tax=Arsenophonus nasoniae TaxID=638 RepID=D2TZI1_9GAMM|nr:hypothetical protein ARN_15960 [Arsenophonus nasoniae]
MILLFMLIFIAIIKYLHFITLNKYLLILLSSYKNLWWPLLDRLAINFYSINTLMTLPSTFK